MCMYRLWQKVRTPSASQRARRQTSALLGMSRDYAAYHCRNRPATVGRAKFLFVALVPKRYYTGEHLTGCARGAATKARWSPGQNGNGMGTDQTVNHKGLG